MARPNAPGNYGMVDASQRADKRTMEQVQRDLAKKRKRDQEDTA